MGQPPGRRHRTGRVSEEQIIAVSAHFAGFPSAGCRRRSCAVRRPAEAPRLTHQGAQYLAAQLRAFKSGERRNDIYSRMRNVAAVLSDMEIESLAAFYSTTFAY
jgi:hypothetical protein